MTPAEYRNILPLVGRRVVIRWRDPAHDWRYFRLLDADIRIGAIHLRGMDNPENGAQHDGNAFWADWSGVASIEGYAE